MPNRKLLFFAFSISSRHIFSDYMRYNLMSLKKYVFAQSVGQYFKERCMVGTINLDYPANRATFFEIFHDECVPTDVDHGRPSWPCLLVRKPGYKTKMLTERVVDGSFELAELKQWGFAVSADKLSKVKVSRSALTLIFRGNNVAKNFETNSRRSLRATE